MAGDPEVQVFRIPREWWCKFDRTPNEVLHKLGFVHLPDGGWACGKDTAQRVVNTVCAYSFGWEGDTAPAPQNRSDNRSGKAARGRRATTHPEAARACSR